MNTKSYKQEIIKKSDIKLSEDYQKGVNISNSEESYEEYTKKELEYIDKYKPMTLNRMSDEEIYELIVKYNFNDEKIERELNEYKKLILNKGDEYSWSIVNEGKKKKLYINEPKEKLPNPLDNNQYYHPFNYFTKKNYYNPSLDTQSRYKQNFYENNYKKNYREEVNYPENTENVNEKYLQDQFENVNLNQANPTNYYNSYNNYRGRGYSRGRGRGRGRGFGRGRGNYASYSYQTRDQYTVEKNLTPEITTIPNTTEKDKNLPLVNAEKDEVPIQNIKTIEIKHEDAKEEIVKKEKNILENISDNSESAIEHFLSSSDKNKSDSNHKPKFNEAKSTTDKVNIFNSKNYENSNLSKLKNLIEDVEVENNPNKSENNIPQSLNIIEKNQTKEQIQHNISHSVNVSIESSNINTNVNNIVKETEINIISKEKPVNKFDDVVSVQNASFVVYAPINQVNKPTRVNYENVSSQAHNFTVSGQMSNKFNPNNQIKSGNSPISSSANLNANPNNLNAKNLHNLQGQSLNQMKVENTANPYNMMGGDMPNSYPYGAANAAANPLMQQGFYPMPMYYYPQQGQQSQQGTGNVEQSFPAGSANPSTPFIPYPMGYYMHPYMYGQNENKDAENLNKNRKNNYYSNPNYSGINNEQTNPQQSQAQGMPYSPYLYFNSQYPGMGMNQMMGVNPNQGMGWNPSTGAMAQMGVNPMSSMQGNYDGQNYNMKNDQQNMNNLFQYKYQNEN